MKKTWREVAIIALASLFSTFLIWLPFFLRLDSFWNMALPAEGMATVMKNFDGPYYVIVAKTLYNPKLITTMFSFDLPTIYYSAHFPLYPIFIKIGGLVVNHFWSMLSVTLIASALAAVVFYRLVRDFKLSKNPFWLSILFLFLPARWLVVRSVGSPEPLFILTLLSSFYFFKKGLADNQRKNFLLAGIFGGLTQLTKPPGILLFITYGIYFLWENYFHHLRPASRQGGGGAKKFTLSESEGPLSSEVKLWPLIKSASPLLLIPAALLAVFLYYLYAYNDFLAYFHSGDNIHLFWPPLQVFNKAAAWVGTFWLEEVIYVYLLGILGVILLFKQKRYDLAIFAAVFFYTILFVSHRDISRYSLPLWPFLLIAFEKFLVKKEFKIAFVVILLPIYLYAVNFIAGNTLAISDWAPFL